MNARTHGWIHSNEDGPAQPTGKEVQRRHKPEPDKYTVKILEFTEKGGHRFENGHDLHIFSKQSFQSLDQPVSITASIVTLNGDPDQRISIPLDQGDFDPVLLI